MIYSSKNMDGNHINDLIDVLLYEAEILDNHQYDKWIDMLTEDIEYKMPVRITREKEDKETDLELSKSQYHFIDNKESILMRVNRYKNEYAWSENPLSRTKHFITNVRIEKVNETESIVKSYVLFYRSRRDNAYPEIFAYERLDKFRYENNKWKLAKRNIIPENSVLPLMNLSNFL
ncbi:aromatic-ring-hydroxylating dioxygenase subunit beta [Acidiplasma aeolicum]|nr:3-phenylpropionate/cinnamic acid dioxygenase subunit beta [Acidiplasma aeolicum]